MEWSIVAALFGTLAAVEWKRRTALRRRVLWQRVQLALLEGPLDGRVLRERCHWPGSLVAFYNELAAMQDAGLLQRRIKDSGRVRVHEFRLARAVAEPSQKSRQS